MKRQGLISVGVLNLLLLVGGLTPVFSEEAVLPNEAKGLLAKAAGWESYRTTFTLEAKEADGKLFKLQGTILYKKPAHRRLEIHEGEAKENTQLLVSDGKTEWQYYPQSAVVYRITTPPEPPGPHRPFSEAKPETVRFMKRVEGGPEVLLRFEGQPLPASVEGAPVPVKQIRVDVAEKDGLLRRMVLLDEKGQEVLTQEYSQVEVNVPIADDQFIFTLPEGVAVMDLPPAGANQPAQPKEETK